MPEIDVHFPRAGIDISVGFSRQPARDVSMGQNDYARTCRLAYNVRGFDAAKNRARGGSRAGFSKYIASPLVLGWIVQHLDTMTTTINPTGGAMQQSNSGRVVVLVAVSQGNVYIANAGDTAWTATINNTGSNPPLNFTGVMQSSANQQKLWFADGVNWCYYVPSTNSVERWVASSGALPVDSALNTPRLIATWRGRTVLSGLLKDPQNWFMSAVNDPTNFNYSPPSTSPTQAIAGNNAPQGLIGDVVTGLIPYTDDVLIFGGDHTLYMMRGDPMAGGQIDKISEVIGMAWGQAWCQDPYGNIYFVSNRMGIYTLVPGQQPQRISQAIEQTLQQIDTGANGIRLIWDDRFQGLHVFVTPLDEPDTTTHFFFEQRSGAWWYDQFANKNHNPLACVTFDGNEPGDRVPLIGSWDGYVRAIDPTATTDDNYAINTEVFIGPFGTELQDDVMLDEIQGVLSEAAGTVNFEVYIGRSAEHALTNDPVLAGTWGSGRNLTNAIRQAGHAIYLRLTSSDPWAMESVRIKMQELGAVRRRGA